MKQIVPCSRSLVNRSKSGKETFTHKNQKPHDALPSTKSIGEKMQKIVLLSIATLITTTILAHADNIPTSAKKENLVTGSVIIDMHGTKLKVPTTSFASEINTSDGKTYGGQYHDNYGNVTEIPNVNTYRNGLFMLRYMEKDNASFKPTTYSQYHQMVTLLKKENKPSLESTTLSDGSTKLISPGMEIYLLPKSKLPTANNEPVTVFCQNNENKLGSVSICSVRYLYKPTLFLGYTINRREVSEDSYIKYDQKVRDKIESMAKAAK